MIWDERGVDIVAAGGDASVGSGTNNIREIEGLTMGLEWAYEMGRRVAVGFVDSELVWNFIHGLTAPKNEVLRKSVARLRKTLQRFEAWTIHHVPREYNQLADWVTNKAMDDFVSRCSTTAQGIGDGVRVDKEMVMEWVLVNQPATPWSHAYVHVYDVMYCSTMRLSSPVILIG